MSEARLAVHFAGPLVSLQDEGRVGHMRYGVPASGPMDRVAFAAANAALGNAPSNTAIEVSLGGLILDCKSGTVTLSIAGGEFAVDHAGKKTNSWTILTLTQGERLSIRGGRSGSWTYIAFAGDIIASKWLGHTATHSTSGFGGGALRAGQEIVVEQAAIRQDREAAFEQPDFRPDNGCIRVVMGPQDRWFRNDAIDAFQNSKFSLTDNFDRMGVRLDGANLPIKAALSIPSEPIVRGSVQVSGEGVPTILLADHQTTGGYPKIATVISPDTDVLAQMRSRQLINFDVISPTAAVDITRQFSHNLQEYLARISIPSGTLEQRLMRENLISGIVFSVDQ